MKKIITILTMGILLTGCSGSSYNYNDIYEDYDATKDYFADVATEAMYEVKHDGYCQDVGASNETECLETFRDELIECVYDAITD